MSEVAPTVTPGWYDDGTGRQRWWDGQSWQQQYADEAGWRINPATGVKQYWDGRQWGIAKKPTNHVLHLLLSIITVGLWIPVWIIVSISNA